MFLLLLLLLFGFYVHSAVNFPRKNKQEPLSSYVFISINISDHEKQHHKVDVEQLCFTEQQVYWKLSALHEASLLTPKGTDFYFCLLLKQVILINKVVKKKKYPENMFYVNISLKSVPKVCSLITCTAKCDSVAKEHRNKTFVQDQ